MKITRECDYAIRIVLMLCNLGSGAIAGAAQIADAQAVPKQFTLKILRKLMAAGYVKSFKGAQGGYSLNTAPKDVSVLDILTAIDGDFAINDCLECGYICNRVGNPENCVVYNQFKSLNSQIKDSLSGLTFDKLVLN